MVLALGDEVEIVIRSFMPKFVPQKPTALNVDAGEVMKYARIADDGDALLVENLISMAERYILDKADIAISRFDLVVSVAPGERLVFTVPFLPAEDVVDCSVSGKTVPVDKYSFVDGVFRCEEFERSEDVLVTIACGYVAPEDVPPDLKLAVMMMVAHLYDNRSGGAGVAPACVVDILSRFKRKLRF